MLISNSLIIPRHSHYASLTFFALSVVCPHSLRLIILTCHNHSSATTMLLATLLAGCLLAIVSSKKLDKEMTSTVYILLCISIYTMIVICIEK